MIKEEIEFIIDTLETMVEWSEYADDYFKQKYNLNKDKESVDKCIKILNNYKLIETK